MKKKKSAKLNFKGGFLADVKKLRKRKGKWFTTTAQPFNVHGRD